MPQPPVERVTELTAIAALHQPTRRRIVEHLRLHGPSTVGDLAAALGQRAGSISHHLKTLEQAGFVESAPELATDRRESWWRGITRRVSWSADDFADSPADVLLATSAERANLAHHSSKVLAWLDEREEYDVAWTRASYVTDRWAIATPAELGELARRLERLLDEWTEEVESAAHREGASDPGTAGGSASGRTPVFISVHANPARP